MASKSMKLCLEYKNVVWKPKWFELFLTLSIQEYQDEGFSSAWWLSVVKLLGNSFPYVKELLYSHCLYLSLVR